MVRITTTKFELNVAQTLIENLQADIAALFQLLDSKNRSEATLNSAAHRAYTKAKHFAVYMAEGLNKIASSKITREGDSLWISPNFSDEECGIARTIARLPALNPQGFEDRVPSALLDLLLAQYNLSYDFIDGVYWDDSPYVDKFDKGFWNRQYGDEPLPSDTPVGAMRLINAYMADVTYALSSLRLFVPEQRQFS